MFSSRYRLVSIISSKNESQKQEDFLGKFVILPISRLARMVGFFAKQTVALMRRIE